MKSLTTLLLLFTAFSLSAQVHYGKITYVRTTEVRLQNHTDERTAEDKQVQAMVEKMMASGAFNKTYVASFGPGAFNCVEQAKDAAEMTQEMPGGAQITVMTGEEDPAHFYTDTKEGTVLNTDYIFDKGFLVSGETDELDWQLTQEKVPPSDMTAGLDLLIATAVTSNGDTLTAGYAPSLPVQVGPLNFHGLPGAIITLEIPNKGESIVYRATNIEVSPEPLEISQPTEGKPISREKFRSQQKKKIASQKRMMMRG
ncbi:MAG: GLPGLI family protein [Bacteroidota bacterium]